MDALFWCGISLTITGRVIKNNYAFAGGILWMLVAYTLKGMVR
jgi:hypothetical protein